MKYVFDLLKEKLESKEYLLKVYPEWIAQAKEQNNNYGVEIYTSDMNQTKTQVADIKLAIKTLSKIFK